MDQRNQIRPKRQRVHINAVDPVRGVEADHGGHERPGAKGASREGRDLTGRG